MQQNNSGRIGTRVLTNTVGEPVRAYIPKPLPPVPSLDLARLLGRLDNANLALGRLDGIASILPSTSLFVFMYVRKVPIPTIPGSRSDPFRAPVPGDPGQRFQSNPGSPDGSGDSVTIFVG